MSPVRNSAVQAANAEGAVPAHLGGVVRRRRKKRAAGPKPTGNNKRLFFYIPVLNVTLFVLLVSIKVYILESYARGSTLNAILCESKAQ